MKKVVLVLVLLALIGAVPASADVFNVRPATLGPGSFDGDANLLQTLMTGLGSSINVATDQSGAAIFTTQAASGSVASLVLEVAGNAGINDFGIYSFADPSKLVTVFRGSDAPGDPLTTGSVRLITFSGTGSVEATGSGGYSSGVVTDFGSQFGFFLRTGNTVVYSEDSLNGGLPQALIFAGAGDNINYPGVVGGTDLNHFWIAFEDMPYGAGNDNDFNDMVVLMESVQPVVPEPGSMLLLGTGLFGLAGVVRRRRMAK